jgi:hypothetical protein
VKMLLEKLKTKYAIQPQVAPLPIAQIGGIVSSQVDMVIQKHPELSNLKQLFDSIPEDVSAELGAEDILKIVGDSTVKVEPSDVFITDLTTNISSAKQATEDILRTNTEIVQQQEQESSITTSAPPHLTMDDLKLSPAVKNPSSGESGKYIFVPIDKVQSTIDFLLSNGCEITTTVL